MIASTTERRPVRACDCGLPYSLPVTFHCIAIERTPGSPIVNIGLEEGCCDNLRRTIVVKAGSARRDFHSLEFIWLSKDQDDAQPVCNSTTHPLPTVAGLISRRQTSARKNNIILPENRYFPTSFGSVIEVWHNGCELNHSPNLMFLHPMFLPHRQLTISSLQKFANSLL